MSTVFRLHLALASFSQREVMEVRVQLERWSAHEAAQAAGRGNLEDLDRLLEAMKSPEIESARFNAIDAAFHLGLAEAADNRLLATLMSAIRDAVQREMAAAFADLANAPAVMSQLASEHAAILEAVRGGKAEEAADLVQAHIEGFYGYLDVDRRRT
ncbi:MULTISPECIES: FCD domain-containing protein [unclassified Nocardioides]|uniref:FadR/GntR family transcriptional regulator n=1 Tax=unclassified Nocardioides TaxID=2615069 RepID=UPI001EE3DA71|nr:MULTISPECIES: FCD domain-containing protein [unclassified Nocardioides]